MGMSKIDRRCWGGGGGPGGRPKSFSRLSRFNTHLEDDPHPAVDVVLHLVAFTDHLNKEYL